MDKKKKTPDTAEAKGNKCYRCGEKSVQVALRDGKLVPVCRSH